MQPIENEGRTVAEAVETALNKSGLRRDQVEITVIEEGAAGFMGFSGRWLACCSAVTARMVASP